MSAGCKACGRPLPPRGVLAVDLDRVEVMNEGRLVRTDHSEFLLLAHMARARGKAVSSGSLAATIGVHAKSHVLYQRVATLRRKLGHDRIGMVPWVGYRLEGRVQIRGTGAF